ncbi:DUF4232 domain-containing protein [Actinoplanes sp. NPDC049596]|uniref:DUF4232 domain-containing protein n=1 Tax=unclassified Actinoplanes TaxID=2626549 RepID=UPI003418FF3A
MTLRRFLPLLAVPLLAACTKPWQATNGLAPTPSIAVPPATAPPTVVPTPPVAIEAAAACDLTGVLISATRGDAAMGYREMSLIIRNCGSKPYAVQGRPDIVVLGKDGRPLDISVEPSVHYTPAPKRLVLKPGASARSVLSWRNTVTNVGGYSDTGTTLAVAPSETSTRQLVPLQYSMDLGNTGRLEASPWF